MSMSTMSHYPNVRVRERQPFFRLGELRAIGCAERVRFHYGMKISPGAFPSAYLP